PRGRPPLHAFVEAVAVDIQAHAGLQPLADELAIPRDEEGLRDALDAVVRQRVARPVVHERIAHPVLLRKPPSFAANVVDVHPEDDETLAAIAVPDMLEHRRLLLARDAPRGPEVEDDRATSVGSSRELCVA